VSGSTLAETWLRYHTISSDAILLDRLIRYNAETGWRLVLILHRLSLATATDVRFADWSGPLGRLLHHHAHALGERVIELARHDPEFRRRLAPLADAETVPAPLIDALGAICGWQRRVRPRRPNPVIDEATTLVGLDIRPPTAAEDWRQIDRKRSEAELAVLAASWLEREEIQWAFDDVDELVQSNRVVAAWNLVLELVQRASTDSHLWSIGAGPIEDFLGVNGEAWIDRVERQAAADPKFCYALARSWRARMSESVWERVQRASEFGRQDRYFPSSSGESQASGPA
jgi:hypothetical protein